MNSIVGITIMTVLGIVSVVGISLSDFWFFRAAGVLIMFGLLTWTVHHYISDHMPKRDKADMKPTA